MAAAIGSGARQGARKWLANLLGENLLPQATSVASKEAKNASRSIAKERLQIILAHQRGSQILAGVNLQALQSELLQVVQRHIHVANGANINLAVKHEGQLDIFEMQVPVVDSKTNTSTGSINTSRHR